MQLIHGFILLMAAVMMLCMSPTAMASSDTTSTILSKLQGQWYDSKGNLVLDFKDNKLNGCVVSGVYNLAGGTSDFSCIVRVIEADGYRNVPIIGENLRPDNYHQHVILNGDNKDERNGTMLLRSKDVTYHESVGGIGLDMPVKDVLAKYGKPDGIRRDDVRKELIVWQYKKLGLELTIRHNRVFIIKIYRNGNRHFDRTGFDCFNTPNEFKSEYGFNRVPKAGEYGSYAVGHGEYMWFDDYPNSITLSMFWN